MNINHKEASTIAAMAGALAERQSNGSAATSSVIECMIAASSALISNMFTDKAPHQDRMLFCLTLAGACATIKPEDDSHFGLTVSITPATLSEAIRVYMSITGKDIRPYLPAPMVKFAESERLAMH